MRQVDRRIICVDDAVRQAVRVRVSLVRVHQVSRFLACFRGGVVEHVFAFEFEFGMFGLFYILQGSC